LTWDAGGPLQPYSAVLGLRLGRSRAPARAG